MAVKLKNEPRDDWTYKHVSIGDAEAAARRAAAQIDPQKNQFGHLLCVALIGICRELQNVRAGQDQVANRLSVVVRELDIDLDGFRLPRE